MRPFIVFICASLFLAFVKPEHTNNVNTWQLYLNQKVLLHNKAGATVPIFLKDIKASDTLGIVYNVCGDYEHSSGYVPSLFVSDESGKLLKVYYNYESLTKGYRAEMPGSDLIAYAAASKSLKLSFCLNSRNSSSPVQPMCTLKIE